MPPPRTPDPKPNVPTRPNGGVLVNPVPTGALGGSTAGPAGTPAAQGQPTSSPGNSGQPGGGYTPPPPNGPLVPPAPADNPNAQPGNTPGAGAGQNGNGQNASGTNVTDPPGTGKPQTKKPKDKPPTTPPGGKKKGKGTDGGAGTLERPGPIELSGKDDTGLGLQPGGAISPVPGNGTLGLGGQSNSAGDGSGDRGSKKVGPARQISPTAPQLLVPIRSRDTGAGTEPAVATTMNRIFVTMLGRPMDLTRGLDTRRAVAQMPDGLRSRIDAMTPTTYRAEAYGAQPVVEFTRTTRGPGSRATGGTGPGGLAFMPPEAGIEDARIRSALPNTVSTPYFTLWGARLAFGLPDTKTGRVLSGFELDQPGTGKLTLQSRNASGTLDTATIKFDRNSGPKIGFFGAAAVTQRTAPTLPGAITLTGVYAADFANLQTWIGQQAAFDAASNGVVSAAAGGVGLSA